MPDRADAGTRKPGTKQWAAEEARAVFRDLDEPGLSAFAYLPIGAGVWPLSHRTHSASSRYPCGVPRATAVLSRSSWSVRAQRCEFERSASSSWRS